MINTNKISFLKSATVVALLLVLNGSSKRTWALTTAIPSAGLTITSTVVGAAAAAEGSVEDTRSKWNRKLLIFGGSIIFAVDPEPAAYLKGTSVITFPDQFLEFQELTWYGPFSDMSTGDIGPTCDEGCQYGSGFFNDVKVFEAQRHNPNITYNTSVQSGVLTVSWSADPYIITENEPVNIFGAAFKNISGNDLLFEINPSIPIDPPISISEEFNNPSPNLYQNIEAQSLICIPSIEEEPLQEPQNCGYSNDPITFTVTTPTTPEPTPIISFFVLGAFKVVTRIKRKLNL